MNQREDLSKALQERTAKRAGREIQSSRPQFRTAWETRDKSYKFRPEYGWNMNEEGLLAEQERKGAYDENVSSYGQQVASAKQKAQSAAESGRANVGSAYDQHLAQLQASLGEQLSKSNRAYDQAIGKVGSQAQKAYQDARSQHKPGKKPVYDHEKAAEWENYKEHSYNPKMKEWNYANNRYQDYVKRSDSAINNARDANIKSLRQQKSASASGIRGLHAKQVSNLGAQKSASLANFDKQASTAMANAQKVWNENLGVLKGAYGKSVEEGAGRFQEMREQYSKSIRDVGTGLLDGNAHAFSAEDTAKYMPDVKGLSRQELVSLAAQAEADGDTQKYNYLLQIIAGTNEEKIQQEESTRYRGLPRPS